MKPGTFPLSLYRGDTARWKFQLWEDAAKTVPSDLTGVTALAEIRDKAGGKFLAPLACVVTPPNVIDMTLASSDSGMLPVDLTCGSPTMAVGVWDMELTYPSGDVMTLLAGPVKVTADITKPEPTLYASR